MLDGVGGGDRHLQRLRGRVADVLAGEDDHAAGDVARVLAALEHRRQVVQRRVGVRAARGLDPGRDVVVVLVAALVVADGLALHRVLGVGEGDLLAGAGRGVQRELERVQRRARVPARAPGDEVDHLVGGRPADLGQRPPQQPGDVVLRELVQLVDLGARDQGGVDLEVRVLGRRADQHHQALLDRGQQRVLLGLVEAVDLVQEEDRVAAGAAALAGAGDHLAHLGAPRLDGRELLEGGVGVLGGHPRERRLAGPGRAVEDHRVRLAGLDRGPQRARRAQQVRLADELLERARAHARRQRQIPRCGLRTPGRVVRHVEEPSHCGKYAACPARP